RRSKAPAPSECARPRAQQARLAQSTALKRNSLATASIGARCAFVDGHGASSPISLDARLACAYLTWNGVVLNMRPYASLLLILSSLLPLMDHAGETANARLWCLSLRFQQGSDSFGDTLDLSTISGTPNGELAPYNGTTYVSGFALDNS